MAWKLFIPKISDIYLSPISTRLSTTKEIAIPFPIRIISQNFVLSPLPLFASMRRWIGNEIRVAGSVRREMNQSRGAWTRKECGNGVS